MEFENSQGTLSGQKFSFSIMPGPQSGHMFLQLFIPYLDLLFKYSLRDQWHHQPFTSFLVSSITKMAAIAFFQTCQFLLLLLAHFLMPLDYQESSQH